VLYNQLMWRERMNTPNARPSYYDQLGVSPSASEEEIRRAFRTLAKEHHPDSGGDEERFKEISQAYDILKNEGKRRAYDASRHGSEAGSRPAPPPRPEPTEAEMRAAQERFAHELRRMQEEALKRREEVLRRFQESQRRDRADWEHSSSPKERPHAAPPPEDENRYRQTRPESETPLSISKEGLYSYLTRDGQRMSIGYDSIHQPKNGRYFLGERKGLGLCLIEPHSGMQLGTYYESISFRGSLIIGMKSGLGECLVDPATGLAIGTYYESIDRRGGLLIGKKQGLGECVIDAETGQSRGKHYDSIEERNGRVVGIRYGREETLV
jgi:curved DNA-binding protein CbpA